MNRFNSRAGIFLMEIMLAILFFSLASALCLQMFVKSRQISKDAANLTQASAHVQNAAELIKHATADASSNAKNAFFPDCLLTEYSRMETLPDKTRICFDENWNHCAEENGFYCMEAVPSQTEQNNLFCCQFTVFETDSGDSIYSLDLKVHIPNRNAALSESGNTIQK